MLSCFDVDCSMQILLRPKTQMINSCIVMKFCFVGLENAITKRQILNFECTMDLETFETVAFFKNVNMFEKKPKKKKLERRERIILETDGDIEK